MPNKILKCITNWTAGGLSSPRKTKNGAKNTTNQSSFFQVTNTKAANHDEAKSAGSSHQIPVNWEDDTDLQNQGEESSKVPAVTLLGPPKQYYGDESEDRYAYMMHDAISLLQRNGYSNNISLLQSQSVATATATATAKKSRKKATKQSYRRVPGLLGFLLNDMTSETKIAVFEPSVDQNLVAFLGFRTYKQPWLQVSCRSDLNEESIAALMQVFSRRFFLIRIPHSFNTFSIPTRSTSALPTGDCKTTKESDDDSLVVKMTIGTMVLEANAQEDHLSTKFVFERDGKMVARAMWSFTNDRRDSVGPAMEVFESGKSGIDLGLVLATMEDKMIDFVAPLVAFSLRLCKVDDPTASRWFSRRGYSENSDGTCFAKAFVVF